MQRARPDWGRSVHGTAVCTAPQRSGSRETPGLAYGARLARLT